VTSLRMRGVVQPASSRLATARSITILFFIGNS
jgi:hypothetical protein